MAVMARHDQPLTSCKLQPKSYRRHCEQEFRDMVGRCSKAGVSIIADAVVNHAAAGPKLYHTLHARHMDVS